MIGYALCGSFCTHARSIAALRELLARGYEVCPIVSEIVFCTDTRFGSAKERIETLEALCGQAVVHSIAGAEPFGPKTVLDLLIIAPCTGNTLAKLCAGITDSCVTMAAKAQLRADRPVLLGVATNDALSANAQNLAKIAQHRHITLLPMEKDDPEKKPYSMVCRCDLLAQTADEILRGTPG